MPQRNGYSRAETVSDLIVHLIGLGAAVLAVPVLVTLTWTQGGGAMSVLGVSVYGATLVMMILCSTLYNANHMPRLSPVLRRLDHSAIYLKIAGTYTAFALTATEPAGWFLAWIWGCALGGAGLRSLAPDSWRGAAIGLYLVMGWSGAVAGGALFDDMSSRAFGLILTGGIVYTAGFGFYLSPRLRFHRTIWHVFVMTASAVFFAAVMVHVTGPR
ncbi:hemolysin III family protein [Paracoccus sp. Ld10]|uniref:PAQR family membrane homeostasis protein TrhA n=1 Tax=Paracoccus sp. Ld10 TaxID=649158 RepID=UPI003864D328